MKIVLALPMSWLIGAVALSAQQSAEELKAVSASIGAAPVEQQTEDLNLRAYIQLLRTDIQKSRAEIVGKVMQLDPTEANTFWPIYKDFQRELEKIGDQTVSVLTEYSKNYDQMTEKLADRLALQVLDIQQQRNDLKRKYYSRFRTALDPITAARFLQIENQIENLLDLQVESRLPVVGGSDRLVIGAGK